MKRLRLGEWPRIAPLIVSLSAMSCGAPQQAKTNVAKAEQAADRSLTTNGSNTSRAAEALAGRIEPSSLSPLLWNVPLWVIQEVRRADFSEEELTDAYLMLLDEALRNPGFQRTQIVHGMFVALIGLEQYRTDGKCGDTCMATIVDIYGRFSYWGTDENDELVGALLHNLGWASVGPERARELSQFFFQVVKNSEQSASAVMAAFLREKSVSPSMTMSLRIIAKVKGDRGQVDLARDLYVASMDWYPDPKNSDDHGAHLAVASNACYRALDIKCGDRFRSDFLKTEPTEEEIAARNKWRKIAMSAVSAKTRTGVSGALALGKAYQDLYRLLDAKDTFVEVIREYPNDARAFVGLAKLEALKNPDLAAAIVAKAGPDNRNQDFYELAIGSWFGGPVQALLAGIGVKDPEVQENFDILVKDIPRVRGLIKSYSEYRPARAELLDSVITLGLDVLPIFLQEKSQWIAHQDKFFSAIGDAVGRAQASMSKYPGDEEIARYRLLLATYDSDFNRSVAAVRDVASREAQVKPVAGMRRTVQFLVGVRKPGSALLGKLQRELRQIKEPTFAEQALALDVSTVTRKRMGTKTWKQLAGKYEALAQNSELDFQSRLLNNSGVAAYQSGEGDAASAPLQLAMTLEPDSAVPGINLYAISEENGNGKADAALIWTESRPDDTREQKMLGAWKIAKEVKDRRVRKAEIQKALKPAAELLTPLSSQINGAYTEKSTSIGLGYEEANGFVVEIDVRADTWLWLTP